MADQTGSVLRRHSSEPGRPLSSGVSRQERIDSILERALARAQPNLNAPTSSAPRMDPLLGGASSHRPRNNTTSFSSSDGESDAQASVGVAVAGASVERTRRRPGSSTSYQTMNTHQSSSRRRTGPQPPADAAADRAVDDGRAGLLARAKATLASFGSVELENKGSVARDHLALERTFLAWLRTSVSFASVGIAVTQLFRLNTSLRNGGSDGPSNHTQEELRRLGKPLGAVFLGISILILFLGYSRYVRGQRWVMAGRFPASRGTVIVVTLITFAVMVASLTIVILFSPGG